MAELNNAVRSGDTETVERLLKTNKVNRFYKDTSALMVACQCGHVALVKLLVKKGANVNLQNGSGWSALMKAAVSGNVEVTKTLLECGAKTSLKTSEEGSALMIACRSSNKSSKVVKLLLQQGCDEADVVISLLVACKAGYVKVVEAILEYSTKPINVLFVPRLVGHPRVHYSASEYTGWTALTKASAYGHSQVVDVLLKNGADIDLKNKDGISALMVAIENDMQETATLLVEKGADLDLHGKLDTALTLAARKSNAHIARLLLDKGASIDLQNNVGETCLMVACHFRSFSKELSKLLLERNASVNLQDDKSNSALLNAAKYYAAKYYAAVYYNLLLELIELLLEKGAEIDLAADSGESPMTILQGESEAILVS